jgi:hypothetical protein
MDELIEDKVQTADLDSPNRLNLRNNLRYASLTIQEKNHLDERANPTNATPTFSGGERKVNGSDL